MIVPAYLIYFAQISAQIGAKPRLRCTGVVQIKNTSDKKTGVALTPVFIASTLNPRFNRHAPRRTPAQTHTR